MQNRISPKPLTAVILVLLFAFSMLASGCAKTSTKLDTAISQAEAAAARADAAAMRAEKAADDAAMAAEKAERIFEKKMKK